MVNRSGNVGTATETAVVRVLNAHGFPTAERRRLRGRYDLGDITGCPGLVWEVKGGNAARHASDALIEQWLDETEQERDNAHAWHGVLVVARKGIGPANADRWWAIVRAHHGDVSVTVRYYLADYLTLLRMRGYGEPLQRAS